MWDPLADRLHRAKHRLRQHHHPRPAAVGLVVGRAMPIGRVLAQIPHAHVEQSLLDPARDHALGEERLEHVREDGDEVDAHACESSSLKSQSLTVSRALCATLRL